MTEGFAVIYSIFSSLEPTDLAYGIFGCWIVYISLWFSFPKRKWLSPAAVHLQSTPRAVSTTERSRQGEDTVENAFAFLSQPCCRGDLLTKWKEERKRGQKEESTPAMNDPASSRISSNSKQSHSTLLNLAVQQVTMIHNLAIYINETTCIHKWGKRRGKGRHKNSMKL